MKKESSVDLIYSIGELAGLFEHSTSLESFLQKVVSVVAWHMKAAVCSVYLLDDRSQELVLLANQGLNPDQIGKLRLKLGDGITGKALQELRTIREASGTSNQFFKFIPGSYEERYQAFLAVPIVRGLTRVGVLVVQDTQRDYFDENDSKALRAIAAQLASTIENARLLMDLHRMKHASSESEKKDKEKDLTFLKGTSASQGITIGLSTSIGMKSDWLTDMDHEELPLTEADFARAMEKTGVQIQQVQTQMEERLEDIASLVFSAHLLMLKDDAFSGEMLRRIQEGVFPKKAIIEVVRQYVDLFSKSSNPLLREKVQDVKDVGRRLLHNLHPQGEKEPDYKGHVVIAKELLPSDIFKLAAQRVEAMVLIGTGVSSHISVLARSLKIPMVIVSEERLLELSENVPILVDGNQGNVFVRPGPDVIRNYEAVREADLQARAVKDDVLASTTTADGQRIRLMANVNLLSDLPVVFRLKAEGIGLYRSEFPFIVRNDFPSEEEQYRVYRKLVEAMGDKSVVFRTLDVGGDKMLSYFPSVNEANPFLGLRALRFSLRNKDVFSQQLRALLRAGEGHELRIMFPLVSSVDDFINAREIVRESSRQLSEEGVSHNPCPRLGIMIELPSAVEVANELAREADFISIGSNDLIQYILAVDRTNAHISEWYLSYHPAVLRTLYRIVQAAQRHQKEFSLCGDMAHDLQMLPFLLGIGISTLSLDAAYIPAVQKAVMSLRMDQAREQAKAMLEMGRISEVKAFLNRTVESSEKASSRPECDQRKMREVPE